MPNIDTRPDYGSRADRASPGGTTSLRRIEGHRDASHSINGRSVAYRAAVEETHILDDNGIPQATYVTFSYTLADSNTAPRPVVFLFNGGPGSSAQWLHMGGLGPRRVVVPSEPLSAGAAPFSVVDNDASLLDVADLVFFDPVGTGFSRACAPRDPKEYWGLLEDARAMADFVYRWITDHGRWNSPKYLLGESYGTVRASLVADLLADRHIALNGVVLIAAVLDCQNSRPRSEDGGILSYVSFLPTYAAIARYHGLIDSQGRDMPAFLDEVREFARTEYALALIANEHRLSGEHVSRVVGAMSKYTGLSEAYIRLSRLRVPPQRFLKELLRDRHTVLGRLDGRYAGTEPDWVGEATYSDPTFDAIGGAFTAALHMTLAELGVQVERPYIGLDTNIEEVWNWLLIKRAPSGGGFVNVVPNLGRAMRRNAQLRVLVASGYFDLSTPFFGAENALSQDGVVQERVAYTYYEVGHMIFLHEPSRLRLADDIRAFIRPRDEP